METECIIIHRYSNIKIISAFSFHPTKDVINMNNKGIKPVSTSIYTNSPAWLDISTNNYDYLALDKDATKKDVDLFLFSLFIYNNIPFTAEAKSSILNLYNDLVNDDGFVLGGGLMFYEGDKKILPSCCCGLEDWSKTVKGIFDKRDVWLGHAPTPIIEYHEHSILVWSDDYRESSDPSNSKSSLISIEFSLTDLESYFTQLKNDIKYFFEILFYERLKEIDKSSYERVAKAVMTKFNVV